MILEDRCLRVTMLATILNPVNVAVAVVQRMTYEAMGSGISREISAARKISSGNFSASAKNFALLASLIVSRCK
jgi:hypothetical protein